MTFSQHYLLGLHCGWTVGSFDDEFGVEPVGVLFVDRFLEGCRNEEVSLLIDCLLFGESLATGKIRNSFILILVIV